MLISVYTDGSCDSTTGFGSYGYVFVGKFRGKNRMKKFSSVKYADTTNNRMEMKAILKAMRGVDVGHNVDVYSDSQYCINGINQWLSNWMKKGKLKDKANADLWEMFIEIRDEHIKGGTVFNFTWVRGHNGNEFNEVADKLAEVGRLKQGTGIVCKKYN